MWDQSNDLNGNNKPMCSPYFGTKKGVERRTRNDETIQRFVDSL